jgi:hypothetical protein
MRFIIERMSLNDTLPPQPWGEADGSEAAEVVTFVVARDGAVEVGVRASFADGQALTIARKGESLYAVLACPKP